MFSQPLHGFPDITAIITGDRYCLMPNHGLSVGGFKIHEAAVMLASLLFSLWLSVNTTTVQHCLPAYTFSCVLVSTALSSLGFPSSNHVISGSPKKLFRRTTWVTPAQSADPKPEAPAAVFSVSQNGSEVRFHQGTLRMVPPAIVLCPEHPAVPTQDSLQAQRLPNFFWLLTSF